MTSHLNLFQDKRRQERQFTSILRVSSMLLRSREFAWAFSWEVHPPPKYSLGLGRKIITGCSRGSWGQEPGHSWVRQLSCLSERSRVGRGCILSYCPQATHGKHVHEHTNTCIPKITRLGSDRARPGTLPRPWLSALPALPLRSDPGGQR